MNSTTRSSMSERFFRLLMLLYPGAFRDRFGSEMRQLFHDQLLAARTGGGRLAVLRLVVRTLPAFAWAGLRERWETRGSTPATRQRESLLSTTHADLRHAARTLWKRPMFALVAIGCIAVGSGAVTTIFSTMNALILRPLPGTADGATLVRIERKIPGRPDGVSASYPLYQMMQQRTRTLEDLFAWSKTSLTLRSGTDAGHAVYGSLVTGNLFTALGVRPLLGRFFTPPDDSDDPAGQVLVVSEGYWRAHLGADSSAVGREVLVNGVPFTLIGIAPRAFQGMDAPIQSDAWVPLHTQRLLQPNPPSLDDWAVFRLRLGGRMRPASTHAAVHTELSGMVSALASEPVEAEWLHSHTDMRVSALMGLPPDATDTLGGFLGLLLGAAALVLIIASVNVAGLLSARAVARRREMAVRAALGAPRGRLIRQLLTEVLVLFGLGAIGGAIVALAATRALERLPLPTEIPFDLVLTPDPRVFGFALLLSLATGVVVGLAPIRQAVRMDVEAQLRDGAATGTARRSLAGRALVIGQLAVSLLLLVGAGLFVRALQRAGGIDPGFNSAGVVTAPLDTETWGYDEARGRQFYEALHITLAQVPGVVMVSATTVLPLNLNHSNDYIQLPGDRSDRSDNGTLIQQIMIDDGYFGVMQIPLIAGRALDQRDHLQAPGAAVVNETFARSFWPDGSALGRTFGYHGAQVTIVGIARDAKYGSLDEGRAALAYFPLRQQWRARRSIMVRTSGDPVALVPQLQAAIRATDPNAPRVLMTTLTASTGVALLPQRVAAIVTGVLGAVGLLLSMAGLYGVIAYSAARRTREIGIRLALGARAADVLHMIVREGMVLIGAGVTLGLLLAAAGTRLLSSLLLGVSPLDLGTYLVMPAILITVALLASYLPARRAAATEPASVLKSE